MNILSKFQLPSSSIWKIFELKDESMNELINESVTEVIVEQPRLNQIC